MDEQTLLDLQLPPPLDSDDPMTKALICAAFEWLEENTTIDFTSEPLPGGVYPFIEQYIQVMSRPIGTTSEKLADLSRAMSTRDAMDSIWLLAEQLLGKWMKSQVDFIQATQRWQ